MTDGKDAFEARIARLAETNGNGVPAPESPERRAVRAGVSPWLRFALPLISLLGVAAVFGAAWPEIKQFYVADASDPQRQGTFLERSILDNMTDAEISRMNSDPRLKGKTQMQKLLLSH